MRFPNSDIGSTAANACYGLFPGAGVLHPKVMLHYRVERPAETAETLPRVDGAPHSGERGRADPVGEAVLPWHCEAGSGYRRPMRGMRK